MSNVTEQFVDKIYQLSKKDFSENQILQVKRCLVDYVGVAIAGSVVNKKKMESFINDSEGNYSSINIKKKVSLNAAVIMNAYNAHTLELDDGHRLGMLHIGATLFSALFGVAEQKKCTLNELYKGAIVGYEATIRLARTIQPNHKKRGFHASGTCGTIGCALGIAAMLGYNKEEMLNVTSAAATSAAGVLEVITGKSEQKPYNIANAANAAINAAIFGKNFCGPEDILGGERGFLRNFSDDFDEKQLTKESEELAISGIYMKPYAACRHCHAPIEAAITIGQKGKNTVDEVEKIVVDTYSLAVFGHDHDKIEGINSAKMSIPYGVAAALLFQKAGLEMFTEEMIKNKNILSLARKVEVNADEELSALAPDKRAAIVWVKYTNGTENRVRIDYPKGEPENPLCETELKDKFNSLVLSAGISEEQAEKIYCFIMKEQDDSVKKLLSIINREE